MLRWPYPPAGPHSGANPALGPLPQLLSQLPAAQAAGPGYWPEPPAIYNQGAYQSWRQMGLNEMLLDNHIIFLDLPLDPRIMINGNTVCSHLIKSMLHLSVRKDKDIHMYINSPGGDIDDTLAIYDTMKYLKCDIATYCIGSASSGAAVILAAGTKGKRYALPHSKIMIHQPWGYIGGQASDMRIQAEEIMKVKETICDIMARSTGKEKSRIEQDIERDRYMSAQEALAYGLVDEIIEEHKDPRKK